MYKPWSDPVSGVKKMLRPPGVKIGLLEFDVSSTKSCDIGKKGRSQSWCLLGFVRLNPGLFRMFFVRMV